MFYNPITCVYSHVINTFNFRMQRYGTSDPKEWEKGNAYYSRLTLSSSTGLWRPRTQYPNLNIARPTSSTVVNSPLARYGLFRTELLDLGQVRTYYELCKLIFNGIYPIF